MTQLLDIKYFYEDTGEEAAQKEEINLTSEKWAKLPPELLQDLRDATLTLDTEAICAAIECIEPLDADTMKGLPSTLDDYQIGLIHDLLGNDDEKRARQKDELQKR